MAPLSGIPNIHAGFWGLLDQLKHGNIYWNISNHKFLIFPGFISFMFIILILTAWILLTSELCIYTCIVYPLPVITGK